MGRIRLLDSVTINQIAAGEVIDRPASLVKEFVENSLDADATSITVVVQDGGKALIQVTDNGSGIEAEDLPLAVKRHATSKISKLTDIYGIHSFGFRGEALASACHAGKLTIESRVDGQPAYRIEAFEDTFQPPTACSHPNGTTISVRGLFGHIPVRQRYLKSAATETAYIADVVTHLSLLNPSIDFRLVSDGKELVNSTGISDPAQLITLLFGRSVRDHLLTVDSWMGPVRFTGFFGAPTLTFPNRNKQVLAVNGRLIKSAVIQKAIAQSFRDVIPANRHPLIVLNIEVEGDLVDVNIHPQKQDVKFINPGFLFDAFSKLVQSTLTVHHRDLGASLSNASSVAKPLNTPNTSNSPNSPTTQPESALKSTQTVAADLTFQDRFHSLHSAASPTSTVSESTSSESTSAFSSPNSAPSSPGSQPGFSAEYQAFHPVNFSRQVVASGLPLSGSPSDSPAGSLLKSSADSASNSLTGAASFSAALFSSSTLEDTSFEYLHVFDTYIVVKTVNGLWLLDQHAVHERVLYEKFKENFNKSGHTQPLMISEVIHLDPGLFAVYESVKPKLDALQFITEPFGQTDILVREIPVDFVDFGIKSLILDLLAQFKELPGSQADLTLAQKDKLQMMACKAAIKAGKRMTKQEIEALIRAFIQSPSNFSCPHGRPLFIQWGKAQLESLFNRR